MLDQPLELFETFAAQLLGPRPAILITTVDASGRVNAAPYAFITPVSYVPLRVGFSVARPKHTRLLSYHYSIKMGVDEALKRKEYANEDEKTTLKDTLRNVLETGEFGFSVMSVEYIHSVVVTSYRWPHDINEIEVAGLIPYPSSKIKPPLIMEASVALECKMIANYDFPGDPDFTFVVGECVAAHIDSKIIEGGEPKSERLTTLLQFGGAVYGVCREFLYGPRRDYPILIPVMPSAER
jgi:flavin reductase (DIM6/NTAB) family NADH-FMN oxidoreductase RutF